MSTRLADALKVYAALKSLCRPVFEQVCLEEEVAADMCHTYWKWYSASPMEFCLSCPDFALVRRIYQVAMESAES